MNKQKVQNLPPADQVTIKKPTITPVNRRIMCITVGTEMRANPETGIFEPTLTTAVGKGGRTKEIPRYFVAKAASDVQFEIENGEMYTPVIGDEVIPFFPPDAEGFEFPVIRDSGASEVYTMLEQMEIAAIRKGLPVEK